MEPYPSRVPARVGRGDFAASLTLLDDMVETLSGVGMMSCCRAVLEEYVTERGR
ncbi:hypothetical protein [Streptomyces sp. P9-A2]|uniref:hypothetical protein n=1 Tax=Streptomyces sp. P9-A2 TaxID=3072284 RepID=UPI002FC9E36D